MVPNKYDYFCETLKILQPIMLALAGGPSAIKALLIGGNVNVDVNSIPTLPWWIIVLFIIASFIIGHILQMCVPSTVTLPTIANQQMSKVTISTPDLGPTHPPTKIEVEPMKAENIIQQKA